MATQRSFPISRLMNIFRGLSDYQSRSFSVLTTFGTTRRRLIKQAQNYHGINLSHPETIGVALVHRHGDRSPIVNLSGEENIWKSRLPSSEELSMFNDLYTIESMSNRPHHDAHSFPYQHLTTRGMHQLRKVGKTVRRHFHQLDLDYSPIEVEIHKSTVLVNFDF